MEMLPKLPDNYYAECLAELMKHYEELQKAMALVKMDDEVPTLPKEDVQKLIPAAWKELEGMQAALENFELAAAQACAASQ